MTLTHLLPELDKLSRAEKLRVIQHLAHELESDEVSTDDVFAMNTVYEIWSPQDAGGAVDTLHKLLEEEKQGNDAR